jgi:hypothetical protein
VFLFEGGLLSAGSSAGTLTLNGDLVLDGGAMVLEALGSALDKIIVTGDLILNDGHIRVLLDREPTDTLDFFEIAGETIIGDDFDGVLATAMLGEYVAPGSMVTVDLQGAQNVAPMLLTTHVQVVPLPAAAWLLLSTLGLFAFAARRQVSA